MACKKAGNSPWLGATRLRFFFLTDDLILISLERLDFRGLLNYSFCSFTSIEGRIVESLNSLMTLIAFKCLGRIFTFFCYGDE